MGEPRTKRSDGLVASSMDMTPMIDVVFNLLIFFVVCGQTASNEVTALFLPAADVAVDDSPDPERFIVNVTREGHVVYRGLMCTPQTLGYYLPREACQAAQRGRGPAKILIRADQDALYDFVQAVMLQCSAAGIVHLQFGVVSRAEGR